MWEDEPTKEYPFPHAELNYYQVKIHHFPGEVPQTETRGGTAQGGPQTAGDPTQPSTTPGTQPTVPSAMLPTQGRRPVRQMNALDETRVNEEPAEVIFSTDASPLVLDPNALDPYEPITFEPWIMSLDEGGFRTRDLIRELRDAPEFGLRVNQYFQDRTFVKQQERNFNGIFCKWIILARQTPGWNQSTFLEMGRAIIQSLRDAYWRARRVDVELVHEKMQKDVRPNDKFYHHVSDQLAEREKRLSRAYATYVPQGSQRYFTPHVTPARAPAPYRRPGMLCFGCRSPDHVWKNCPKRDFRSRVAGPAGSSKSL